MVSKVTIKDVAREAGVSVGSVSNVINENPALRSDTIARVQAAMRKLSYSPNAAARNMRTQTTGAIGFVINDISNPIYAAIAKEAEYLLNKQGYHLILVDSDNRPGQEVEIFSMLGANRVDAIVATLSDERDPGVYSCLAQYPVPVVLLDRNVEALATSSVCIDYATGVEKAVNYLLHLGHEDIALICGGREIRPGRECVKGYEAAMNAANMAVKDNLVRSGALSGEFGYKEARDLFDRANRPTALICGANRIFAGALKAAKNLKLQIPKDLSLIACDDTDLTSLATPSFTVLKRDTKEIGKALAREVLRTLSGDASKVNKIMLDAELLIRESCSPVSKL